jgi:transposase
MEQDTIIGIDLSKRFMQICVANGLGELIEEVRVPRDRLVEAVERYPHAVVVMEACGGAHHWGRVFERLGREVRLIAPELAKAYRNPAFKDDRRDARAITEAGSRRHVRSIPVKSEACQGLQCLQRLEELHARQRTQLGNALRGLLGEYGIVLPKGPHQLKARVPALMASPAWAQLPHELQAALGELYTEFCRSEERLKGAKTALLAAAARHPLSAVLDSVPGLGPLTAAGFVAAVEDAARFARSRDFAVWLGLTPRLYQSGNKCVLLGVSKRGNPHLRSLFVLGAQSLLRRYKEGRHAGDPLAEWARALLRRKAWNVVAVALANKLARIAWRVAVSGAPYRPRNA